MSNKPEKSDFGKGSSKVLRKAKSFKDDIKSRIAKRTPSNSRNNSPTRKASPTKSPKHRPRGLGRSINVEPCVVPPSTSHDNLDTEKLEAHSRKVYQTLSYLKDAVNKGIPQLIPGSVTIVLETMTDVQQLLSSYFINHQESSMLTSLYNAVYQSLAQLVQWANLLSLDEAQTIGEKEVALSVISGVQNATQELVRLSTEKLRHRNSSPGYQTLPSPKSPAASSKPSTPTDSSQRSSLPTLPLSPREKEILEDTRFKFPSCPPQTGQDCTDGPSGDHPPPKPPLPPSWNISKSDDSSEGPPLPPKTRPPSSSSLDNPLLTALPPKPASRTSSSGLMVKSQPSSLSASPQSFTPLSQSPTGSASSGFSQSSEDLLDDGQSGMSLEPRLMSLQQQDRRFSQYDNCDMQTLTGPVTTSADGRQRTPGGGSAVTTISSSKNRRFQFSQERVEEHETFLGSPDLSRRQKLSSSTMMSSSTAMATSASAAKVIHQGELQVKSEAASAMSHFETAQAQVVEGEGVYDNFQNVKMQVQRQHQQEQRRTVHAVNTGTGTRSPAHHQEAPPLPAKTSGKARERMCSTYDNITTPPADEPTTPTPLTGIEMSRSEEDHLVSQIRAENFAARAYAASSHHHVPMRTSHSAMALSSNSYKTQSLCTMQSRSTHMALSREAFSSSETFSSAGTFSSGESLQKPPPLPPKKKKVPTATLR